MMNKKTIALSVAMLGVFALGFLSPPSRSAQTYETLGGWNKNGVPDYLESQREAYTSKFLKTVTRALPERKNIARKHPEYLAEGVLTRVKLRAESEVFVSFLHEAAGYKNALGFFTYTEGNEPQTPSDIETHTIIFPNTSYKGSGGGLRSGDTVSIGVHPADTMIGFFLVANGFHKQDVRNRKWTLYSQPHLNPENDAEKRKHVVVLWHPETKRAVMAFEDIRRDKKKCDHDFNDTIFTVRTGAPDAIATDGLALVPGSNPDSDGDGVFDANDSFPSDPDRAFIEYNPSSDSPGYVAFEDLWPNKGDYDFNDLVVAYAYTYITNARSQIKDIEATYEVKAVGARNHSGFGIQMDLPADTPVQMTKSINGGAAETIAPAPYETKLVTIVFTDAFNHISPAEGAEFVNTEPGTPEVQGDTIAINWTFATPVARDALGDAPYNPFLHWSNTQIQIHLPDHPPTDRAHSYLFGTGDDDSNPATGRYYKTELNLPWAIVTPRAWRHPLEFIEIAEAYPNFQAWVESNGEEAQDWYLYPLEPLVW